MAGELKPLTGRIAIVAGATRAAGRGIACMLGAAGATVYCSGRSIRGQPATPGRPETIEETAEMVIRHGGVGVPCRCDHAKEESVKALVERVRRDHGRLDILVNDIWGGDEVIGWSQKFWELEVGVVRALFDQAVM